MFYRGENTGDSLSILNSLPGNYLILQANAPAFTILGATDSYLHNTYKTREEIIGKNLFDVFPDNPAIKEATGVQNLRQSLNYVIEHKELNKMKHQRYDVFNRAKGIFEFKVWRPLNKPVLDKNGEVEYIIHSVADVTEKVKLREANNTIKAHRKIEESEARLQSLIKAAPMGIVLYVGRELIVEMPNQSFIDIIGKDKSIIGKPLHEAMPELKGQPFLKILDDVYTTGKTYETVETRVNIVKNGVMHWGYYDFSYTPLFNAKGEVYAILDISVDVTARVLTGKKIEESEQQLQAKIKERTSELEQQKAFINSILEASFTGIYSIQAVRDGEGNISDFRYLFVNSITAKFLGMNADEVVGKNVLELIPENKTNGFFETFCKVLETGEATRNETNFSSEKMNQWFDYAIIPMDSETLVVTVQEITQQKISALQIEQQRNLLNSIMEHSASGILVTEMIRNEKGKVVDGKTIIANATSEKFSGFTLQQILSNKMSENDPNLLTSRLFRQALYTLQTGEPFVTQHYLKSTGKWLEISVAKMDDNRLINVFSDITILKNAQLQIEQSEERLRAVFNSAQAGMFTFSPVYDNNGEIADFRFVITNANFANYVKQTPAILNGALGSTWFPGYMTNGVFDMYKKTFLTGETLRIDIHYNVDGLDIFLDLKSIKVGGEVLVTFTDYTPLKKAQIQLETYLEDLKRSNDSLEEFAYAASHDMKEPIRKIQVFTARLKERLKEKLGEEDIRYFQRLETSAQRMGKLIEDLLEFSHVTNEQSLIEQIDLNKKVTQVLEDLELEIVEKQATVTVAGLPVIKGHRRQLQQLFQNLISNALKFNKPGVAPQVHISAQLVKGKDAGVILPNEDYLRNYYLVEVSDNGIGFEQHYAERIFNMFQRLHGKAEYSGTGIGLSIVRKVVHNHKGHIWAEGHPGAGAIFKVLLPAD